MKTKGEIAKENFLKGYNCAQAVVLAYKDEIGIEEEKLAAISSSFGGGMGRLREVCGAVSGMFMVAGYLYGYDDPKDFQGKKELYELIQRLADEFKKVNGSIVCRELLGLEQKKDDPVPEKRTEEYYKKRPCADMVADAAEILERVINKIK